MSLKKLMILIIAILISTSANSAPPVEVLHACKNVKVPNPTVILTKLKYPHGTTEEAGCEDHFEKTINNLNYGSIICNDDPYIIINGKRIKLDTAENFSINPSIKPNSPIPNRAEWFKIDYSSVSYLCVKFALSDSGDGVDFFQYYIVENAFKSKQPIKLSYYFLNKDVIPLTSS